ncbi:hypothetical protein BDD12DRAFT_981410 [Trichophaea hybrida]|nr:hypothetical protein BDD12DRAFT_981410 [Trichophaea hybrida]
MQTPSITASASSPKQTDAKLLTSLINIGMLIAQKQPTPEAHTQMLEGLLLHGADVDCKFAPKDISEVCRQIRDSSFMALQNATPLHHAALLGNLHAVQLLLAHGAEIDALAGFTMYNVQTPLCYALRNCHKGVALFLLEKGASIEPGI